MMHSMFRLSQAPGTELVAGLSMGGYGAMKLALTYPERFAAAASFSGAVDAEALLRKREPRPTMRRARPGHGPSTAAKTTCSTSWRKTPRPPTSPGSTWPAARRISSSAIIKSLFPPWRKTAGTLPTRNPRLWPRMGLLGRAAGGVPALCPGGLKPRTVAERRDTHELRSADEIRPAVCQPTGWRGRGRHRQAGPLPASAL